MQSWLVFILHFRGKDLYFQESTVVSRLGCVFQQPSGLHSFKDWMRNCRSLQEFADWCNGQWTQMNWGYWNIAFDWKGSAFHDQGFPTSDRGTETHSVLQIMVLQLLCWWRLFLVTTEKKEDTCRWVELYLSMLRFNVRTKGWVIEALVRTTEGRKVKELIVLVSDSCPTACLGSPFLQPRKMCGEPIQCQYLMGPLGFVLLIGAGSKSCTWHSWWVCSPSVPQNGWGLTPTPCLWEDREWQLKNKQQCCRD